MRRSTKGTWSRPIRSPRNGRGAKTDLSGSCASRACHGTNPASTPRKPTRSLRFNGRARYHAARPRRACSSSSSRRARGTMARAPPRQVPPRPRSARDSWLQCTMQSRLRRERSTRPRRGPRRSILRLKGRPALRRRPRDHGLRPSRGDARTAMSARSRRAPADHLVGGYVGFDIQNAAVAAGFKRVERKGKPPAFEAP